jgi:hypothetical protein
MKRGKKVKKLDCNIAEKYFMKYMDGSLEKKEATLLNGHLLVCDKCKEEFFIYDKLLEDFKQMELTQAPSDFEEKVMQEILTMDYDFVYNKNNGLIDNIVFIVWGAISVLLGLGFMLVLGNKQILSYLSENEKLNTYVQVFEPITNYLSTLINTVISTINTNIVGTTDFISMSRYYLLGILAIFAYIVYFRNEKAKSKNM